MIDAWSQFAQEENDYSMAMMAPRPAAATMPWLQLMTLAAPVKAAAGAEVVKVPLAVAGGGRAEAALGVVMMVVGGGGGGAVLLGAWIWPSVIWEMGAAVEAAAVVA